MPDAITIYFVGQYESVRAGNFSSFEIDEDYLQFNINKRVTNVAQLQISPSDCYVNFQNQLTALLYFKSVNCNSYNVVHEFMKMSEMQDILALNLLR